MDIDYFEIVMTNINSDEMYIEGIDKSQNNKLSINSLCIHQNNTLTNIKITGGIEH